MNSISKFLKKYSYKFPKGYLDINDSNDFLLLENILKSELGIIVENTELTTLITKSGMFKSYGDVSIDNKAIVFSDIPSRGSVSDTLRKEAYAKLKNLADKSDEITDFKLSDPGKGSSLGRAEFKFKGKQYLLPIKGKGKEENTDTDIKEGLVSMFYVSNIDSAFTEENFDSRISQLQEGFSKGIPGETSEVTGKIMVFLETAQNNSKFINFINQPLSSALAIKEKYPKQKLIRTGAFDEVRTKASSLTGLPADKWNPGDLYVQISDIGDISNIQDVENLNDLFNDSWGGDSKPLVSISLKQEKAQGGKAKALLQKYTKVKDDYNLTKDEKSYTADQYRKGIEELRPKVQALVNGNENIEYKLTSGEVKDDQARGKYAALKTIEYLFSQFTNDKVDDAVVALAGFALSLTGVNPTFFKVTGKSSGEPGNVEPFERGATVGLYNIDGEYEPIEIVDIPTFGGLKILFLLEKGGEIHNVSLNARNNGTTQGTLEIQNIKQISNQTS